MAPLSLKKLFTSQKKENSFKSNTFKALSSLPVHATKITPLHARAFGRYPAALSRIEHPVEILRMELTLYL
jgi:hypothetical protein